MALSGSVETAKWESSDGSWYRTVIFEWTAVQNVNENYSTINWTIKCGGTNNSNWVSVNEVVATVDGSRVFYQSQSVHIRGYYGTVLGSGSLRLDHDSEGNRSFAVSIQAGMYQYAINRTGNETFVLNKIARSSSIISASDTTLGTICNIKWKPTSQNFSYKIKFVIGNWSSVTSVISPNTTDDYTYGATMPLEIASQITESTSGIVTAYLYTYSDSSCSLQIGTTTSKTFTVIIPNTMFPVLDGVYLSYDNSANAKIAEWGIAVAGYTKIKLEATAQAPYGAKIKKYNIFGNAYNTSVNAEALLYTGVIITSSGNKTFSVEVVDSRGVKSPPAPTMSTEFYPYSPPSISTFVAMRGDGSSSEAVGINVSWSFASVNNNNNTTAKLEYKKQSEITWTKYNGNIENHKVTLLSGTFSKEHTYNFRLTVTDSLGNTAVSESTISSMFATLDFKSGGKGIAFGKFCEQDGFECNWDAQFNQDIIVKGDIIWENSNGEENLLGLTSLSSQGTATFTATGLFSAFIVYVFVDSFYMSSIITPSMLSQLMGVSITNNYYNFTLSVSGTTYTLKNNSSVATSYIVKGLRR